MARSLETLAGSKGTARMETEASGTWEIHHDLGFISEYANRMTSSEECKSRGGSRTR